MKKWGGCAGFFLAVLLLWSGCSVEKTDPARRERLEFTLVEDSRIPEELKTLIEGKKGLAMKITFDEGESKYIVVGYGTQQTGGYSISVEELYLTGNAVHINTNLIGPSKGEAVNKAESFPYIVVKIAYTDKSVVFE